jgi:putative ferrous iron transport protein C
VILSAIREYLQTHGCASLQDMALRFDIDPEALRGMLGQWVVRGRVVRETPARNCGGCSKCDAAALEVYRWRR